MSDTGSESPHSKAEFLTIRYNEYIASLEYSRKENLELDTATRESVNKRLEAFREALHRTCWTSHCHIFRTFEIMAQVTQEIEEISAPLTILSAKQAHFSLVVTHIGPMCYP